MQEDKVCTLPIGSSSYKHKIMGVYYSAFDDIRICSRRSTVQTICLVLHEDIVEFGLNVCLAKIMVELKDIVLQGIFDSKTSRNLQVRVICSLGRVCERIRYSNFINFLCVS